VAGMRRPAIGYSAVSRRWLWMLLRMLIATTTMAITSAR
jgi:hypothetical protein